MRADSVEDWKLRQLLNPASSVKERAFIDYYKAPPLKPQHWCHDAKRSLVTENAGGNSEDSECVSIQCLHDRLGARDVLVEMEVTYNFKYKLCDFICTIRGERFGVSVTRAMAYYPRETEFTANQALALLKKKLIGLVIARECISEEHSFNRCILHILVPTMRVAQLVKEARIRMCQDEDARIEMDYEARTSEVIVLITVSDDIPSVFVTKSNVVRSLSSFLVN